MKAGSAGWARAMGQASAVVSAAGATAHCGTRDQFTLSFSSARGMPVAAETSGAFSAETRPFFSQCSTC